MYTCKSWLKAFHQLKVPHQQSALEVLYVLFKCLCYASYPQIMQLKNVFQYHLLVVQQTLCLKHNRNIFSFLKSIYFSLLVLLCIWLLLASTAADKLYCCLPCLLATVGQKAFLKPWLTVRRYYYSSCIRTLAS